MENTGNILFGIISILVSTGAFVLIRTIIQIKLKKLHDTQKLGLILIIIIGVESTYLGLRFDLFTLAASIITSLGVAFALISFTLQNPLKTWLQGSLDTSE